MDVQPGTTHWKAVEKLAARIAGKSASSAPVPAIVPAGQSVPPPPSDTTSVTTATSPPPPTSSSAAAPMRIVYVNPAALFDGGPVDANAVARVRRTLEEIRVENGYSMILSNEAGASPILAVDPALDITDHVRARLMRRVGTKKP